MISGVFAVALSWMNIKVRCPIIKVPLHEVYNKTTKISGLTLQQSLNKKDCVRPSIADRMWGDQQSLHCELSCMSACKIFLAVELLL